MRSAVIIVVADLHWPRFFAGENDTAAEILKGLLEARRQSYVPAICLDAFTVAWAILTRRSSGSRQHAERNGEMVFLVSEIVGAADDDPLNRSRTSRDVIALEKMKLP